MDDLAIINHSNIWFEATTIHFSAMTTFVAIYIAGLYAFLRSAPLPVRVIAYTFFVGTFILFVRIGIGFLKNAYASMDIIAEAMDESAMTEAFNSWRVLAWYDAAAFGIFWYALMALTVLALGWLTFFYRWKQVGEE